MDKTEDIMLNEINKIQKATNFMFCLNQPGCRIKITKGWEDGREAWVTGG
jgi:hypothetical protein